MLKLLKIEAEKLRDDLRKQIYSEAEIFAGFVRVLCILEKFLSDSVPGFACYLAKKNTKPKLGKTED